MTDRKMSRLQAPDMSEVMTQLFVLEECASSNIGMKPYRTLMYALRL
jgi:hypothetical protein